MNGCNMAIWQCLNCGTIIKQNFVEKCAGCGGKVRHIEGYIKDQDVEKQTKKRKAKQ